MTYKRKRLKNVMSILLTLFNTLIISLFCRESFDDSFVVVAIILSIGLYKFVHYIKKQWIELQSIAFYDGEVKLKNKFKEYLYQEGDIQNYNLVFSSKKVVAVEVSTEDKTFVIRKNHKLFEGLLVYLENHQVDKIQIFEGTSKNKVTYAKHMTWQNYIKTRSFEDVKSLYPIWILMFLLLMSFNLASSDLMDSLIKSFIFLIISMLLTGFYRYLGWSVKDAVLKSLSFATRLPISLFSIAYCIDLLIQ